MSTDNTKRQPAGIPTGGQFAIHGRPDSAVNLLDPIDADLRSDLDAAEVGSGYLAIDVDDRLAILAPGVNQIELRRSRTRKTIAAAHFGGVNFIEWAAAVKGVNYEDPDGEAEALAYLNTHHGAMLDYFEKHGVEAPSEYEWDDSVLIASTPVDSTGEVSWASTAMTLNSAPNTIWVAEGLADNRSEMFRGLQEACAINRL